MQINLVDVGYTYKDAPTLAFPALNGLNLSIPEGQFVSLIGPSGSGKSTLALLLAGLYLPTVGRVTIDGRSAIKTAPFREVGIVFQYPEQQFFCETVYDEVAFGAHNFGVKKDQLPQVVEGALESVGLDAGLFGKRSPFSLSGGEKRRIAIASILALPASILVFDEPTAGLDPQGRRWINDLAKKQQNKGRTIVWITHNMDEAAALSDRILVLAGGRVILDGTPREVFNSASELADIGLELPHGAKLVRRLKEKGSNVAGQALTADEAIIEICRAGVVLDAEG